MTRESASTEWTRRVVTLGDDVCEADLLVHDEAAKEPSLAYFLTRMHYPTFPEPIGVFRCVDRPKV